MRLTALSLFLFSSIAPADDKKTPLPAEWHGTWVGKMTATNSADKATEVAITLKIEPIKDGDAVAWVVTYGEADKKLVKDYKLLPVAGKAGRFRIDEQNGVVLDARLVGGVLYSHFEVGGSWLTARYELRDGAMRFEVTSAKPAAETTGGGQVQGHTVEAVQTAELKKK